MLTRTLAVGFVLAIAPDAAAQIDRPAEVPTVRPQPVQQPQVICGMRILPADSTLDRELVKPAPRGAFTLRTPTAQVCSQRSPQTTSELKNRLPQIFGPKR
jgi:hypothetical protein